MFSKRKLILPQGSFAIINKSTTLYGEIVSPAVQSCIVVVLRSSKGVAFTHIDADAPRNGASTIKKMITELNEMGSADISAELIGGDFGDLFTGSSRICKAVIKELQINKIPFNHKTWNIDPSSVLALVGGFISYIFSNDSKASLGIVVLTMLMLYLCAKISFGSSYDVYMDIASGKIKTLKNDTNNSKKILLEAKNNLHEFPSIFKRWQLTRGNLDVELIRVNPQP